MTRRLPILLGTTVAIVLALAVGLSEESLAAPPASAQGSLTPLSQYQFDTVEGAVILWSPALPAGSALREELRSALLEDLSALPPPTEGTWRDLSGIRIAVAVESPELSVLPSRGHGLGFHRSSRWLLEHGFDGEREQFIEIYNASDYLSRRQTEPLLLAGMVDYAERFRAGLKPAR